MTFFTAVGMFVLGCAACAAEPIPADSKEGAVQVVCHGRLIYKNIVAVAGGPTGPTVSFDGMTWELKLSDKMRRQIEMDDPRHVTITGELHRVAGAQDRVIVDVQTLMKNAGPKKQKAEFKAKGKLVLSPGNPMPKSIDVAGETWPVDWGTDQKQQAEAAGLVGKPVLIEGTAEANTEGGTKKYPIFHISKLQAK